MRKQRYYIDTSIIGGFFDTEFCEDAKMLFEQLERKEVCFVLSDVLDYELERAPEKVRTLLNRYSKDNFEKIVMSKEAEWLAEQYIVEKVVGVSCLIDCRHIATATLANVDVIVSWNFKHIVNLDRIKRFNAVNLKNGLPMIEIRSPRELNRNSHED
ncbi:MAG: PIN domain-containing protein [Bacteroidales bacterium]|nr:PIN domain-containing protein [Bacteroidales bacterium]